MAMAQAYTLAGELHAAGGDHESAFRAFAHELKPFVQRKQKGARGFAASFVPKTPLGLWLRNISLNTIGALGLTKVIFREQLRDPFTLKAY